MSKRLYMNGQYSIHDVAELRSRGGRMHRGRYFLPLAEQRPKMAQRMNEHTKMPDIRNEDGVVQFPHARDEMPGSRLLRRLGRRR